MPILSKTSYLIFIVSNFLGTVHGQGFIFLSNKNKHLDLRCLYQLRKVLVFPWAF